MHYFLRLLNCSIHSIPHYFLYFSFILFFFFLLHNTQFSFFTVYPASFYSFHLLVLASFHAAIFSCSFSFTVQEHSSEWTSRMLPSFVCFSNPVCPRCIFSLFLFPSFHHCHTNYLPNISLCSLAEYPKCSISILI